MATLPLTADHSVAIIGAGISGLACGQVLANLGASVTLFDKARGPGGRMSSKRRPHTALDLGAQAFSVRDPVFQCAVDEWIAAGRLAPWPTRTYQASPSGWQAHSDGQKRYAGVPRMSALTRHLADSLTALPHVELHLNTHIVELQRAHKGWRLVDAEDAAYGPFDQLVISVPSPQAYDLIADWDADLAAACQTQQQRACWAGWAIFDGPLPAIPGVDPNWQMARIADSDLIQDCHPALNPELKPVLKIVSRNQTKPGRGTQPESLSLLAQLDWSEAHLELTSEVVAEKLLAALKSILPTSAALPKLMDIGAHRWRYAQPASPYEHAYLYTGSGLALCGDSFQRGRVEEAWLSGHRLGEALIGRSV